MAEEKKDRKSLRRLPLPTLTRFNIGTRETKAPTRKVREVTQVTVPGGFTPAILRIP